jgi:hypothetical protein
VQKRKINGFDRITKRAAFNAYKNGKTVYFFPVNIAPGTMWHCEIAIKNDSPRKWEDIVNEFEYYNCINSETGKYTAFYIKRGE